MGSGTMLNSGVRAGLCVEENNIRRVGTHHCLRFVQTPCPRELTDFFEVIKWCFFFGSRTARGGVGQNQPKVALLGWRCRDQPFPKIFFASFFGLAQLRRACPNVISTAQGVQSPAEGCWLEKGCRLAGPPIVVSAGGEHKTPAALPTVRNPTGTWGVCWPRRTNTGLPPATGLHGLFEAGVSSKKKFSRKSTSHRRKANKRQNKNNI